MIKNIVFDLGGVLVDFNPKVYLRHIGFNDEETDILCKIIFYGDEWKNYNSSMYDFNKTLDTLLKHYPEYSNEINLVFNNIDYNYILFENKEVSKYLIDLKEKEFNIYLLSDLSVDSYKSNSQFNFFNYINGGVYSFQVGSTKPNDNNYIELLDKYNLIADETIFIDDSLKNIEAANKFGIHGIQFTSLDEVKDKVNLLTNKKNAN